MPIPGANSLKTDQLTSSKRETRPPRLNFYETPGPPALSTDGGTSQIDLRWVVVFFIGTRSVKDWGVYLIMVNWFAGSCIWELGT